VMGGSFRLATVGCCSAVLIQVVSNKRPTKVIKCVFCSLQLCLDPPP
jgi:hypothetical protein